METFRDIMRLIVCNPNDSVVIRTLSADNPGEFWDMHCDNKLGCVIRINTTVTMFIRFQIRRFLFWKSIVAKVYVPSSMSFGERKTFDIDDRIATLTGLIGAHATSVLMTYPATAHDTSNVITFPIGDQT